MRLAGQIKMGYYPTPPSVVDRVKGYFQFPNTGFAALDPCCGEGSALARVLEGTSGRGYGVELDFARAEEARKRLTKVLKGGFESTIISHGAFSLLWLNPPYDANTAPDEKSERKEKSFLRDSVCHLVPGGAIVYIIPQSRLALDVAKILTYRFENITVRRFHGKEYQAFRQIVVLGTKKKEPSLDKEGAEILVKAAESELPELEESAVSQHLVPATRTEIQTFRSTVIDPAELLNQLNNSSAYRRSRLALDHGDVGVNLARPPIPLHTGHLGLLLAAGHLNGVVGTGPNRHLVQGRVVKETIQSEDEEREGVTKERDVYRVTLKYLTKKGELVTLM
ncbi:MAG: DUF6094 domain-containing protein [Bacillota bacterium]